MEEKNSKGDADEKKQSNDEDGDGISLRIVGRAGEKQSGDKNGDGTKKAY